MIPTITETSCAYKTTFPLFRDAKTDLVKIAYDKTIYALRKRIEQFFGKIKENRHLAVRYEKSDLVILAFIALAAIIAII